MTKSENTSLQKLNANDKEIVEIMSKLLNCSELEVASAVALFQNVDETVQNCLFALSRLNDSKKITAMMQLEYLLI